ncbi:single insulin-like growth factor-binding domain protein-2 [Penaeus japonicus]|uniref:single insulin-like growth factor-binding domain protein-2 n=1 Tax=Penaeus japonicus TaxID=27405 RepID=UPI001C71448A|nr:single insulin-like growth factor-binding domain protein-2 [Penaeus japonicus]XP_042890014.1 single insulin-like growth factor-binding domain protein-2 [Penaeus japonicus]
MKVLLCFAVCLVLCLVRVTGLRCIPQEGCTPSAMSGLDCSFGFVTGPCHDCECAKGLDEVCGGPWDFRGKCAKGLACDKDPEDFNADGVCRPRKKKEVR